MSRSPTLELPPVEAIDAVPLTELPIVLAHLAALSARVAARLLMLMPAPEADRLLDVHEAAKLLCCSEDWLRRNAATFPFTRKPGPGQLRFSARGVDAYIRNGGRSW